MDTSLHVHMYKVLVMVNHSVFDGQIKQLCCQGNKDVRFSILEHVAVVTLACVSYWTLYLKVSDSCWPATMQMLVNRYYNYITCPSL